MGRRQAQLKHAEKRARWRYGIEVGREQNAAISELIKHNKPGVRCIERQSHRIGVYMVRWNGGDYPVVFDRKAKVVITFLPKTDSRVVNFLKKEKAMPEDVQPEVFTDRHIDAGEQFFIRYFNGFTDDVNKTATEKGFWKDKKTGETINVFDRDVLGNKLMHVIGELSEAHEVTRKHENFAKVPCEKPVDITAMEEEFADTIIRLMDTGKALGMNLGRAIVLKAKYNKSRPYMHGKQS